MHATVKSWGNAYAIRLTKADLERHGIKEGQDVEVQIVASQRRDLTNLPYFRGDGRPVKKLLEEMYDAVPERWQP